MSDEVSSVHYINYLSLEKILDSQFPLSGEGENAAHEEMLFIIIHQTYELWFKQIIHELDSILEIFNKDVVSESDVSIAVSRLDRIIEIRKTLRKTQLNNTFNIETVKKFQLVIRNRSSITYDQILNFLVEGGYERVDFVHNKGEFAIRGEIMDIFSPIHRQPLRILFDFEKIDKLNLFSTQDQLSISTVNDYYLSLSSEFQFNSENIECFRSLFRQLKLKDKADYY